MPHVSLFRGIRDEGRVEPASAEKALVQAERIYPVDTYDIPLEIKHVATKYHFIKLPMIGQYNQRAKQMDWCGRTSSSMIWNYYRLIGGQVNSEKDYITHWFLNDGHGMDLRLPDKSLASKNADGGYNTGAHISALGVTKEQCILDFNEGRDRLQAGKRFWGAEEKVLRQCQFVIDSLRKNNPLLFFSGFSTSHFRSHIIVISGYAILPGPTGPTLWLMITDPATPKIGSILCPPRLKDGGDPSLNKDYDPRNLNSASLRAGDFDTIVLQRGDWLASIASLYLVRANKLFEEKHHPDAQFDKLLMDYNIYAGYPSAGGKTFRREAATPFVPELIESNVVNNLCLPWQEDASQLRSPAETYYLIENRGETGFYPLGTQRVLHGGIHLPPQVASSSRMARVMAPGYVVAARLAKPDVAHANPHVLDFLENYNGFVLVRHEVQAGHGGSDIPIHPFYSLYMHLAPTTWPDGPVGDYEKVPWLRQLFLRRFGAIINLDPSKGAVGQIFWVLLNV